MSQQLFTVLNNNASQPVSSAAHQLTSTFIVVGSSSAGKTTMVDAIQQTQTKNPSVGLLYSYLSTNVAGYKATLLFYEVSGQAFKHLAILPVSPLNYNQISFVIVTDLGDNPHDILSTLQREIDELRKQQEEILQKLLTPQQYAQLESNVYQSIESHQDRTRMRPLLLPLTIVGWKYDLFAKNLDVDVRKWISRGLRYLAHLNYASLVFGSLNDCSHVKQSLYHQVKRSGPVCQTDHMKLITVTRGADSVEQIGMPPTSQSVGPIEAITKIVKDQVAINPNPQKAKKKTVEEWDSYREEKVDKLRSEKDKLINQI